MTEMKPSPKLSEVDQLVNYLTTTEDGHKIIGFSKTGALKHLHKAMHLARLVQNARKRESPSQAQPVGVASIDELAIDLQAYIIGLLPNEFPEMCGLSAQERWSNLEEWQRDEYRFAVREVTKRLKLTAEGERLLSGKE